MAYNLYPIASCADLEGVGLGGGGGPDSPGKLKYIKYN